MTNRVTLRQFGLNEAISDSLGPLLTADREAGRVVRVDRGEVDVVCEDRESPLRCSMTTAAKDCVAGDWVAVNGAECRVEAVLPRRTAFVRRAARGATTAQTLAANMDVVLVVQAFDPGVNLRRLERELVLAHQSGATPVVVITKSDRVDEATLQRTVAETQLVAPGVRVVCVSNVTLQGFDDLREIVKIGVTFALLGSSGVGKSTLVNSLAGETVQLEGEIRTGDGKGRHTTTAARLIRLADGRLLLDTPGVRALALWEAWEGLAETFSEIESVTSECQFSDCFHDHEPGCAVLARLEAGSISRERLESWRRLRDEMAELDDLLEAQARKRERTGRAPRN